MVDEACLVAHAARINDLAVANVHKVVMTLPAGNIVTLAHVSYTPVTLPANIAFLTSVVAVAFNTNKHINISIHM